MKRKFKAMSVFLIMIMMVSVLAGCGKEAKVDENITETSESETTIKWAVWDITSTTYYEAIIEAYKKENPDVTVEMVDLGSQDYMTALATQLAGDDTNLDVVCIKDIPGYVNLVSKNVLEPVDTTNLDLSVYGGITDQIQVDDVLYALPFRSDFWLIYYNKDIFDAAGVDYPSNDMTLEEYDTLARSVTNTELGSEIYGSHFHTWRSVVQSFAIVDGKHTMVDGTYDFLKPYYDIVIAEQNDGISQDYATLKTSNLHYSGAFAQGNIAMMNIGSWFIPTLIDKIQSGEYTEISNWGLAKYPHPEGVEAGSAPATLTSLSVTRASKHKEAAIGFMNFVAGPSGAEAVALTGTFPAIKTEAVLETIASFEGFPSDVGSKEALVTSNTYLEMPIHAKGAEIEVILNDAHDYIMTGTKTVEEGIAYMNEEVGKILK